MKLGYAVRHLAPYLAESELSYLLAVVIDVSWALKEKALERQRIGGKGIPGRRINMDKSTVRTGTIWG